MVSSRVGIFICSFTPKQGDFLNFATHFGFRCPGIVIFPGLRIAKRCWISYTGHTQNPTKPIRRI